MVTKKKKETPLPLKASSRLKAKAQGKEIDEAVEELAQQQLTTATTSKDATISLTSDSLQTEVIPNTFDDIVDNASVTEVVDGMEDNISIDGSIDPIETLSVEEEREYIVDPSVKDILDQEHIDSLVVSNAEPDPDIAIVNTMAAASTTPIDEAPTSHAATSTLAPTTHAAASPPNANGTSKWGQPGTKPSFVSLFKDNRQPDKGMKLHYIEPKGDIIDLTTRNLSSMVQIWGHCLVAYFDGRFPGLTKIHAMTQKWGVPCRVRSHDKGWVIFKFQNDEDRSKVLMEGPYSLFGKTFHLKPLSEDFSIDDEEFLKVPIWVQFPHLPMRIWEEEIISEVASRVGVPLTTDRVTLEKARSSFARVLIEVDASKAPPLLIPIRLPNGRLHKQRVRYETFPNYCFHCKCFGHHAFTCKVIAQIEKEEMEIARKKNVLETEEEEVEVGTNPTIEEPVTNIGIEHDKGKEKLVNDYEAPKIDHPFFKKLRFSKNSKKKPRRGEITTSSLLDDQTDLQTSRVVRNFHDVYQDEVIFDMDPDEYLTPTIKVKQIDEMDKEATIIKIDHNLKVVNDNEPGMFFTKDCLEGLPEITHTKEGYTYGSVFMRSVYRHFLCRFFEDGCPRGNACKVKNPKKMDLTKSRVIYDIREAYLDDVITKLGVDQDNRPCIHVSHVDEVKEGMTRLDNYLNVTQDGQTMGLNFTTLCLKKLPGVIANEEGYEFTSFFVQYIYDFLFLARYKPRGKTVDNEAKKAKKGRSF
ncbi:unnamed protein product [Cuscuta europaea]|uniref:DUF4283 domain-containing protein n=1 Tax=Cuscuta europaea TaxID=41803 RepID=A0A9P0ZWB3_CUSEU|nr:unnamed protein product [Cuscuta europaea]